jgi:hypothetical protein
MSRILNLGINSVTTKDWLNATRHMKLTALDPCFSDSRADFAEVREQAPDGHEKKSKTEHPPS